MPTTTSCPGCGHALLSDATSCPRCDLILPSPAATLVAAAEAPLPADTTPSSTIRLYSKGQILRAAFLGSLLAGTHLLAVNWCRLGRRDNARRTWIIGVLSFLPILTIAIFVTAETSTSYLLPVVLSLWVAERLFKRQAEPITAAQIAGALPASTWKSLAIPLGYLAALLLCDVVVVAIEDARRIQAVAPFLYPEMGGASDNGNPEVKKPAPIEVQAPPKWTPGQRHPTIPHIASHTVEGQWIADPGYRFLKPTESLVVQWTPGVPHPNYPHIVSHSVEERWAADPGYIFPENSNLTVRWSPGRGHPSFPHITAAAEEGRWNAEAGYRFLKPTETLAVEWTPGLAHPSQPHIVAAAIEGKWRAEEGYAWAAPNDPKSFDVRWTPGLTHPSRQHVVAGAQEGDWVPEEGCEFPAGTGSFHAVPKPQARQRNWGAAITKILGASVLQGVSDEAAKSQPKSEEGLVEALLKGFLKEAVKEGANYGRRELVRSAVADVFPELSARSIDAVTNLVDLSLDRKVTFSNWQSASTRDELVRRLRQEDPSMADAQEAAEFIGKVMDASLSRAANR